MQNRLCWMVVGCALVGCGGSIDGKDDPPSDTAADGEGPTTSPTTSPTGTTPTASYTASLTLEGAVAAAGEAMAYEAVLFNDATGDAVEVVWTLDSDLEPGLGVADGAVVGRVAGGHTITAVTDFGGATYEADATLLVEAGHAASLDLALASGVTWAGVPVGFSLSAADAYDNPVDTTGADVRVEAPARVDGGTVVAEAAGSYLVTAILGGAEDSDTLMVQAGDAVSVSLRLSTMALSAGDSADATVVIVDGYANPLDEDYTLTVVGGDHMVFGDRITFHEEGMYTVRVEVDGTGLTDEVGPIIIDDSGPVLTVITPERGTFTADPTVWVTGTVLDEGDPGLPSLLLDGAPVVVEADGSFSVEAPLVAGMNILRLEASDALGHGTNDTRAVLWGDSLGYGLAGESTLGVRINDGAGGMDTLAVLGESLLTPEDLVTLIPSPVVDEEEEDCVDLWFEEFCFTWYAITLYVENPTFDRTDVKIDSLPTGDLKLTLTLVGPELDWDADAVVAEIPYSGSGDITATNFEIDVTVTPEVVDGEIQVELVSVSASSRHFVFTMDDWLDDVLDFFGIDLSTMVEGFVLDALEDAVADEVPGMVEDLFQDLEIAGEFPILDRTYTFEGIPASIAVDSLGTTLLLDSVVLVDSWVSEHDAPGSLVADYGLPSWGTTGTEMGLSLDFLNQMLYAMWGGNALYMSLDVDELGLDEEMAALLGGEGSALLLDATLPPVVLPSDGPTPYRLQMPAVLIDVTLSEVPLLTAYVSIDADMDVAISEDLTLSAEVGEMTLYVDVVNPEGSDEGLEVALEALVPEFMPGLLDGLAAIPLPTLDGFALEDVVVSAKGPEGGFVVLEGDLVVAE